MGKKTKYEKEEIKMQSQTTGTHVNSLPHEMICKIMSEVVAAELQDDKIAKFDLKNRAVERLQSLKSVCKRWNFALQDSSQKVLKDVLRLLARVGIRPLCVVRKKVGFTGVVTTLLDKVFIIYNTGRNENRVHLDVYRLKGQNLEYEQSTEFPKIRFVESCAACHGCIYVVDYECIWKINPNDLQPVKWLEEDRMHNGYSSINTRISASRDGNLMLILFSSLGIYGPDGNMLEDILLPMNRYPFHVAQKSNGNTVVCHATFDSVCTQILYEYRAGANNNRWNIWMRFTFDQDVKTIWDNENSDGIKVGHGDYEYEEKVDQIIDKFGLDSDDNVITTDQKGKELMVFDSSFQCHKFPLEDSDFKERLTDLHYDEKSNILFLIYRDELTSDTE